MKRIFKYIFAFIIFFIFINNVCAINFPEVSSSSILFENIDKNEVIYSKNEKDKVQIASLTKIMTAIVAIENIKDYDEKVLITKDMLKGIDIDFSIAGFKAGEVATYNDLLYGTLLPSGADATNILAYSISGSIDNFVELMNNKAKELEMSDSSFSNVMGKTEENNYSTATDLSKLLKYCYKNKKFKEVFSSEKYTSSNSLHEMKGPVKKLHSDDLKMNYIIGAKTGYTEKAGLCLASISKYNNDTYILITLGSSKTTYIQHMIDSQTIYNYFFDNYEYKKILSKDEIMVNLKTVYEEEYTIKSDEEVIRYVHKDTNKKDLTYKYSEDKKLEKGIKKGDKIGTFYILEGKDVLYAKVIISPKTVKMTFNYFINHNKVFLICVFIVIILLILCLNKKIKIAKNKHR